MSYVVKRMIKGNPYLYEQESFRENGKVRTRTLRYLGKGSKIVDKWQAGKEFGFTGSTLVDFVAFTEKSGQTNKSNTTTTKHIKSKNNYLVFTQGGLKGPDIIKVKAHSIKEAKDIINKRKDRKSFTIHIIENEKKHYGW